MNQAADVVCNEWDDARKAYGVKILAYVIMPEHIHIMLWAESGKSISMFLQRSMALISKRLEPGAGRFWKERPRVLPVYTPLVTKTKIEYIHSNPVRRELASNSAEWEYSSFRQLVLGCPDERLSCDIWDGALL